jgi:hypothetical protein
MARAEKRKYHYIYKITCNITNRFYIGMHSTDDLDDGYFGSGKRLWHSINYHGKENHVKEILEYLPSRQLLKEREKEIVNEELIGNVMCMNLVVGGEGGYISEEGVKKGREKCNEILKEKYGDDYMKKMMLQYHSSLSSDEKEKRTRKIVKRLKEIDFNHKTFKGKNHSDETKRKIGETNSVKQFGEKNSQYGTCWITKDNINKKIKKKDLDSFIKDGWVKGREM